MNIDPLQNSPKVGRDAVPVDRPPAGQGRQPAAAAAGGLVVSSEGGRFRQLRARLADLPEPAGQAARVKDLTALVASGRYQVDGTRIAQALLRDEPTAALLGLPGGDV
jgi:hypothetical protein